MLSLVIGAGDVVGGVRNHTDHTDRVMTSEIEMPAKAICCGVALAG